MKLESVEKLREWHGVTIGYKDESKQLGEIADEIEREIAERYMELPVDVDGVPIHVGDEVVYDHDCMRLSKSETVAWIAYGAKETHVTTQNNCHENPCCLRHVKPDSVKELVKEVMEYGHIAIKGQDHSSKIDEYAAKIREAVSAE